MPGKSAEPCPKLWLHYGRKGGEGWRRGSKFSPPSQPHVLKEQKEREREGAGFAETK